MLSIMIGHLGRFASEKSSRLRKSFLKSSYFELGFCIIKWQKNKAGKGKNEQKMTVKQFVFCRKIKQFHLLQI